MKERDVFVASLNAPDGVHCIDVRKNAEGSFTWVLCRRDPEDTYGWRVIQGVGGEGYETQTAALQAAAVDFEWVADPA